MTSRPYRDCTGEELATVRENAAFTLRDWTASDKDRFEAQRILITVGAEEAHRRLESESGK